MVSIDDDFNWKLTEHLIYNSFGVVDIKDKELIRNSSIVILNKYRRLILKRGENTDEYIEKNFF